MNPKQIKEGRKQRKLSQAHLAQYLGVRRQTVSDWERGVHKPHRSFVRRLREILTTFPTTAPGNYDEPSS